MTPPADRSGSRRSPDNSQFTVVLHRKFLEHIRDEMKARGEEKRLSEIVRDFLAERYGWEEDKVAGRADRV